VSSALLRRLQFSVVLGITDGILTALTLAAGRLLNAGDPLTLSLALRISAVSLLTGLFMFFTAEYARLRGELVQAAKQLSLSARGQLATTQLGKAVLRESALAAGISALSSFLGSLLPLGLGAVSTRAELSFALTLLALAALGMILGHTLYASPLLWATGLLLMGGILALAGMYLKVV